MIQKLSHQKCIKNYLKTRGSTTNDLNYIASFATLLISKKLKEKPEGVEKEFKVIIFLQSRITG
jgi:hypothetical protein